MIFLDSVYSKVQCENEHKENDNFIYTASAGIYWIKCAIRIWFLKIQFKNNHNNVLATAPQQNITSLCFKILPIF